MGAVERLLQARQELLSKKVCHTVYDEKASEARRDVRESARASPTLRTRSPSKRSGRKLMGSGALKLAALATKQ